MNRGARAHRSSFIPLRRRSLLLSSRAAGARPAGAGRSRDPLLERGNGGGARCASTSLLMTQSGAPPTHPLVSAGDPSTVLRPAGGTSAARDDSESGPGGVASSFILHPSSVGSVTRDPRHVRVICSAHVAQVVSAEFLPHGRRQHDR